MAIYELHPSYTSSANCKYCEVELVYPEEKEGIELKWEINKRRGLSVQDIWPVKMEYTYRSRKKQRGDMPYDFQYSPYLILSQRSVDALLDFLELTGEILPLYCSENPPLAAWHPILQLNALDCEKSGIDYLPSGRPYNVNRYYFLPEKVQDAIVFQIPETSVIFVTDIFLQRVRERKLKGFGFRKLWTPEEGSVHSKNPFGPWPEGEDLNL